MTREDAEKRLEENKTDGGTLAYFPQPIKLTFSQLVNHVGWPEAIYIRFVPWSIRRRLGWLRRHVFDIAISGERGFDLGIWGWRWKRIFWRLLWVWDMNGDMSGPDGRGRPVLFLTEDALEEFFEGMTK